MPEFNLESNPAAESYRLLDFESAVVRPGFVSGTYFLMVRGTKPCINMEVSLSARIYIQCPEYWGIEVVGHLPGGICLTAIGNYDIAIQLTGITGSRGIEVIGATRSEQIEVPGGCSDSQDFTVQETRFIVIALARSGSDKYRGCRVVPEGSSYAKIYGEVFGPASREECDRWVAENCGFDGGDPPE